MEHFEEKLKEWKDRLSECTDDDSPEGMYIQGWIHCLEMSLRYFQEPCNTRMHVDTKARCDKCKNWNDKSIMANFCYNCGRPLSQ